VSGGAAINIANGIAVAVIPNGSFNMSIATGDVVTGNAALGTTGTITAASILTLTISNASLFLGTGASLNAAKDGIVTTGAVGFSVSGASFTYISVSKGTDSFTGISATIGNASLVGAGSIALSVSGTIKLNQTNRLDGQKVDWSSASTTPSGLLPALTLTKDQSFVFSNVTTSLIAGNVKVSISGVDGTFNVQDALATGGAGVVGVLTVGSMSVTDAVGNPLPGITLTVHSVVLKINTTAAMKTVSFGGDDYDLPANYLAVGGNIDFGITAGGFGITLSGGFFFEKSTYTNLSLPVGSQTVTTIKVGVEHVNTTIVAGPVKLTVTDINGAFVLPGNGVAGVLTVASLAVTKADDSPLNGITIGVSTFKLRINTTGAAVNADVNGQAVVFTAQEANLLSVGADLVTVTVNAGPVQLDLTGGFFFEKSSYVDLTKPPGPDQTVQTIKVAVSGVSVSVAAGGVTVAASGINGAFILTDAGIAGKLSVGSLSVTGAPAGLTLNITAVFVQINTTGGAVDATINGQAVQFAADQGQFLSIGGTLSLVLNFGTVAATLAGTFYFEKSTYTPAGGGGAVEIIKIGVTNASTSLTAGNVKVAVNGINGAFILKSSGIAGVLTVNQIALTNAADQPLAGLTLSVSSIKLRINTTGELIDTTVNGQAVVFGAGEGNILSVGGTATLAVSAGPVAISIGGTFFFEKSTYTPSGGSPIATIKVAISNASVSLAAGGVTVNASGINGAFILPGTGLAGKLQVGSISVTGVPGLTINVDQFFVEINTTGGAVDTTVDGQPIVFTADQGQFLSIKGTVLAGTGITVGSLELGLSGTFGFEKTTVPVNGNPNASIIKLSIENGAVSLSAGSIGITASGINGGFILQAPGVIDASSPGGIAGKIKIGAIAVSGFGGGDDTGGLSVTATDIFVEINTTQRDISATVGGVSFSYTGVERRNFVAFGGTIGLDLNIGSIGIHFGGTFRFERSSVSVTTNGVPATETIIKIGLTNVSASLTAGSVGIALNNINGAFIIKSGATKGIAGKITIGATSTDGLNTPGIVISGVPGLTAQVTTASIELNTTGADVSATIDSVSFNYTGADKHNFLAVRGSLNVALSVGPVAVSFSGTLGFEKSTITVAGSPTPTSSSPRAPRPRSRPDLSRLPRQTSRAASSCKMVWREASPSARFRSRVSPASPSRCSPRRSTSTPLAVPSTRWSTASTSSLPRRRANTLRSADRSRCRFLVTTCPRRSSSAAR
jgi:hypothetical protein